MVATGEASVPKGASVLLVHLVNPYGFKFGRRYNENNVDLNRNVILDGVGEGLSGRGLLHPMWFAHLCPGRRGGDVL